MPRKPKWRKVEYIPDIQYFVPLNSGNYLEENILKVEEVEAIRLKDIEKLEQIECAKKMEISRQTFQRILNIAREKLADSIVNGKAIKIEGGNFTKNICSVICKTCSKGWEESYENIQKILKENYKCPYCESKALNCYNKNEEKFCNHKCWEFKEDT